MSDKPAERPDASAASDQSRGRHRRPAGPGGHDGDGRERCPVCRSLRLSVVDVTLSDGSPVSMVSCQECEHRIWRRPDGEQVDLQEVLDKAPRSRRRRPGT